MRISESLAQKIKAVAEKEGYYPNKMAVGLKTGKSNMIGLIVDTVSGHFFADLAEVIEREVDAYGYKVIYCSTGNDAQKGKELIRLLHQHRVDGYMIIPAAGMEKEVSGLEEHGKPVVLLDSYFPKSKMAHVLVDNYGGMSRAVDCLAERGYKKIAFVMNDVTMIQMKERRRAYTDGLKRAGLKERPELVLEVPFADDRTEETKKIQAFLKQTKPDAVLFAANYLGVQGLQAIRNLKWTIPADIGVICFDDDQLFQMHQPPITVVQQPVKEIAKTAVAILMAKLGRNDAALKESVEVEAMLIERESTR